MKKLVAFIITVLLVFCLAVSATAITPGISLNPDEWSHTNQLIAQWEWEGIK